LVTLDDVAATAFADARTLHRPFTGDMAGLWIHRTNVISELLESGYSVLHSDADAVWLKDPWAHYFDSDEDLIFSQGTIWPPDSLATKGLVVCCGLFLMRATPAVKAILPEWMSMTAEFGDDQIAINRLLDRALPEWSISQPYERIYQGQAFTCSPSKMTARAENLSVAVLPHERFPRLVDDLAGVYVAHPLSPKGAAETESVLHAAGLWHL
jgi:hypothetical protein